MPLATCYPNNVQKSSKEGGADKPKKKLDTGDVGNDQELGKRRSSRPHAPKTDDAFDFTGIRSKRRMQAVSGRQECCLQLYAGLAL